jgi:hypothetical protein
MTDPRPGENGGQIPEKPYRDAEAQLGGADAVEKTTYVQGRGTSPEGQTPPGRPTATVPSRGVSLLLWLVLIVVAMLAVAYLGGAFA